MAVTVSQTFMFVVTLTMFVVTLTVFVVTLTMFVVTLTVFVLRRGRVRCFVGCPIFEICLAFFF